uniref:Heparan-sulfate 6-O-sulfotransferase n=1 Tax=Echinococcus granulosus TaxID=6210 RepID=A0A068X325_ECHGR|nr:hypothetical protein EgrG_000769200 [Echinococcus granulosus]
MRRLHSVRNERCGLENEETRSLCGRKYKRIWLVCACVFVTVLLIHGINMSSRKSRLQVPKHILVSALRLC